MPSTNSSSSQDIKDLQASLVPLQPLDLHRKQIRILLLLPGKEADPIRCELYTAHLCDNPHYEALSYVWGNPKIVRPIFLEGRQVQVTVNLEAALRSLRLSYEPRHMWVDALCINQTDDAEKTHQVSLMKEIYEGTTLGLLWLGAPLTMANPPEAQDSHDKLRTHISYRDAFNAFKLIRTIAEADEDAYFINRRYGKAGAIRVTSDSCYGLYAFMNLGWWHRIWTVQEAVLPRKAMVFCGRLELDWSVFVKALRLMERRSWGVCSEGWKSRPSLSTINMENLKVYRLRVDAIENCRRSPLKITDALVSHRYREAGDPRDKLYALLGLKTDWGAQLSVAVDYSLSPRDVFRKMTTELILLTKNLKPLIRLRSPSKDGLLPTWVHDLSATCTDYLSTVLFHYDLYGATEGKGLSVKFNTQRKLQSRGVLVDRVAHIYRGRSSLETMHETCNSEYQSRPYPTGGSYQKALQRTVEGAFNPYRHSDGSRPLAANKTGFVKWDRSNRKRYMRETIIRYAHNTCIFVTRKG